MSTKTASEQELHEAYLALRDLVDDYEFMVRPENRNRPAPVSGVNHAKRLLQKTYEK